MAATNFTPIILYHTTTASAAPTAGNLNNGELAINITDGKLFYKDNGGTVQVIATKGTGTIGGSTTQVQYNNAGSLAGSANFTFNGTTATINTLNLTNALGTTFGGTGLNAYTTGDLVYASGTNTLAKLGIGLNTYILTSTGSVPQWSAPSAVTVATATNLAGGAAGSVPYQSGASTTTFLSIGTQNQVLTSSGTAPQWSSGLTITTLATTGNTTLGDAAADNLTVNATITSNLIFTDNTYDIGASGATRPRSLFLGTNLTVGSLTATRVPYASTGGLLVDSANMTFNGTRLSVADFADASLTSGRVTYATTSGNLTDSANLLYSGTDLTVYGITVGRGAGAVSTNTAVGNTALRVNTTGDQNTSVGYASLYQNLGGSRNTAVGVSAMENNSTGGFNTALGVQALQANTTASNNTAVGYQAGYSNTTGTRIVAVGYLAATSNTTANENTAVGNEALRQNQTGSYNTALGYYSLRNNTASGNTALGYYTLAGNTTGIENVAVGGSGIASGTMVNNTTGSYNTGIGNGALAFNTTASNNTAVGYQAGYLNTTGEITAVGTGSLRANTTGVGNAAFGINTLYSNTTGSGNSAFGTQQSGISNATMYYNTTGANNSAFGTSALRDNTTGSNNTAVGYQAMLINTTASDIVAIGSRALTSYTDPSLGSIVAIGSSALIAATSAFASTVVGAGAGRSITTGDRNTLIGQGAGSGLTTGQSNTIVGPRTTGGGEPGSAITTGSKNSILGAFSGNQGGLDIRTASNYIVLSDGDGNPRVVVDGGGFGGIGVVPANQYAAGGGAAWQIGGATNIWNYAVAGNYQTRIYNNAYLDTAASERYLNTGSASAIQLADGRFFVKSVGSGSAGALASLTTVLDVKVGETLALQGATSQSGTGITFPATQNASSDANTLDDYEEGTWTPTLATNGFNAGATLSSATGRYTKVGRLVSATAQLTMSGFCYPSGYVLIGSLPFTVAFGSVGSYNGSHPGSGNMGGSCSAFNTNIDAPPSAGTTTSTVWVYTVTFIV